jgi:hypothetical protein
MVQELYPSQKFEHQPFWNVWTYLIKSYLAEVPFSDITSVKISSKSTDRFKS